MKRVLLCVALLAVPAAARAQSPGANATSAQADDLTHRGVELIKAHDWVQAEDALKRAWGLKHSYDIAGNLGLAEAALEKWRDAAEHLSYALATFPANGKPAHRDLLAEKLAAARGHVGAVTVDVDQGAEVWVDGRSIGLAPLATPVFVEPGPHTIEARFVGRDAAREQKTLTAGASVTVRLTLPPVAQVPDRRPRIALAATAGGLAVIGIAIGAGLTAAANGKASDVKTLSTGRANWSCTLPSPSCTSLHDAVSSKTTLSNAAASTFIVGGAFVLVGVGLGVWAGRVTPSITPTSVGLVYQGRW